MQVGKTDKALDPNTAKLAEKALASILSTEKFECSPQMTAFLRYVVEQTISGHQSRIKAFSVAVDALGKPNSFDPQNDPVVRVLAGRLRTALDVYADEHPDVPLVISMKKGSYIPIFSGPAVDIDVVTTTNTKQILNQQAKTDKDIGGSDDSVKNVYSEQSASATPNSTRSSLSNSDSNNTPTQGSVQNPSKALWNFNTLLQSFRTYKSRWTIAAMLFAVLGTIQISQFKNNSAPQLIAALPTTEAKPSYRGLTKPIEPCIFVSAVSSGNAFDDNLNTIVSGALANNDKIVVRRILKQDPNEKFWLEDYILSLTSFNLEEESRVNIQLIAATSGLVVHSSPVFLKEHIDDQLSSTALAKIIEAAESIVASNGPLFEHYNADPN